MILSFKKQFAPLIQNGTKQTTIRLDKGNRLNVGRKLHFWKGSPRNPTVNPCRLHSKENAYGEDVIVDVILISINQDNDPKVEMYINYKWRLLKKETVIKLAKIEGFRDVEGFYNYFPERFIGKIICWTDWLYNIINIDIEKDDPLLFYPITHP